MIQLNVTGQFSGTFRIEIEHIFKVHIIENMFLYVFQLHICVIFDFFDRLVSLKGLRIANMKCYIFSSH